MLMVSGVWVAVAEGGGDTVDIIDPYELIDPVEILSKLPADFYEKMVCFLCLVFFVNIMTPYFIE